MRHHPHESDRLESLRSYRILDSEPAAAYDALTALAAMACDTPIALISLVDERRQWFKSRMGMEAQETSRESSFCTVAVAESATLVVPDALADERFAGSELVTGPQRIRAYAGVPLVGLDGLPLGTLCVLDRRARRFTTEQVGMLASLADQAMTLLETRRSDRLLGRPASAATRDLTEPRRLRHALDAGELMPWFQPVIDLATGVPVGLEALLRWNHPDKGILPPAPYLAAVESSGLIMPVGRHVLRESLRMLSRLRAAGHAGLTMAVNVSSAQLSEPGLSAGVAEELAAWGIPPGLLTLELTETTALLDAPVVLGELQALQELGVKLAIDDYGAGYSSLMRVLDLPVSTLKIDRSLIQRLPSDARALAVTRSTVEMAAALGIDVVAEGVERPDQQAALAGLGCRFGQGYLFGAALPAAAVDAALTGWVPCPPSTVGRSHLLKVFQTTRDRASARRWMPAASSGLTAPR